MTNRRHRRCPPQLSALLCLLPLSAALAQSPADAIVLRWQAPRACPTQSDVERLLLRLDHTGALDVLAAVERTGADYRLQLRVRAEGGSFARELRAASCAVLAESTVWLVELALTQLTTAGPQRPGSGDAVATGQAAAVSEPSSQPVDGFEANHPPPVAAAPELSYLSAGAPETTHEEPLTTPEAVSGQGSPLHGVHFRLGVGAAATDVGLSGLTPHLTLDLTLALARWSVALRLGALLHPELAVAGGATVDLQTNAAQLQGCRLWEVGGVLIGPCVTLSGLHSIARTRGLTGTGDSASWLAAGPAVVLQLRLAPAVLASTELGAWAALSPRPSFEVSDTTLARAGTLAGYARLGVSYELW